MRSLFALVLVLSSQPSFAGKLVNQDMRQYFPSFGLGSTQSVAYTSAAASTAQILSPTGGSTELVQIVSSSDAFVAAGGGAAGGTAAATSLYLPAKTPEVVEVLSGTIFSVMQVNSAGNLYVTHLPTFPSSK